VTEENEAEQDARRFSELNKKFNQILQTKKSI
jgi:hypothetical protein